MRHQVSQRLREYFQILYVHRYCFVQSLIALGGFIMSLLVLLSLSSQICRYYRRWSLAHCVLVLFLSVKESTLLIFFLLIVARVCVTHCYFKDFNEKKKNQVETLLFIRTFVLRPTEASRSPSTLSRRLGSSRTICP